MAITRAGQLFWNLKKALGVFGLVLLESARADVTLAPTITTGTGAPTTTEPKGSLYLRRNAPDADNAIYVSNGAGSWNALEAGGSAIADPGTGAAIPVTRSGVCALTIGSAGAETNTLAIPTFIGQEITICADVVGTGTRAVTAASAINVAGNTVMTFDTARDTITLKAIQLAGVLAWEATFNAAVALS